MIDDNDNKALQEAMYRNLLHQIGVEQDKYRRARRDSIRNALLAVLIFVILALYILFL